MQRTFAPAIALLVTLAACSDNTDDTETTSTPATTATAAPSDAPSVEPATQYDTTWDLAEPDIAQSVLNRYSREQAQEGIDVALALVQQFAYDETLIATPLADLTPEDLHLDEYMTDDLREIWHQTARDYVAKGFSAPKAYRAMLAIGSPATFDIAFSDSGFRLPTDGPVVVEPRATRVTVTMANDGSMQVATNTRALIRMTKSGKDYVSAFNRQSSLFMTLGARGWLVDSYYGQFEGQKPRKA